MKVFVVVLAAVIALLTPATIAEAARARQIASGEPALHFASVPGYALTIDGSSWAEGSRVYLTIRSAGENDLLVLRVTTAGDFRVGLRGLNRCNGLTVGAHGSSNERAELRLPLLGCATSFPPPALGLTVLVGTLLTGGGPPRGPRLGRGWHTYRNAGAGYSVDYPGWWSLKERPSSPGYVTTVITAPRGATIQIVARPLTPDDLDPSGSLYPHCRVIKVADLDGMRCFDPASARVITTLRGHNKVFMISAPSGRVFAPIYQQVVNSFRLT